MAVALSLRRAETPVPDVFERAFQVQGVQKLLGYTEPHVIMEHLATDYPDPLSTLLYTSAYAQLNNVQPTSAKVFRFPKELSISDIVKVFRPILRNANIPYAITPGAIDDKTEIVTVNYGPTYGQSSAGSEQIFLPLLYGALDVLIKTCRGAEVQQT